MTVKIPTLAVGDKLYVKRTLYSYWKPVESIWVTFTITCIRSGNYKVWTAGKDGQEFTWDIDKFDAYLVEHPEVRIPPADRVAVDQPKPKEEQMTGVNQYALVTEAQAAELKKPSAEEELRQLREQVKMLQQRLCAVEEQDHGSERFSARAQAMPRGNW